MSEMTVMAPGEETENLPAVRQKMEVSSPIDMDPVQFAAALERRKANRKVLMDWIREALVEGVDFGSIPTRRGPSKKSLWKPGAEKICGMLNVTATFPTLKDYEQACLAGVEIKSIILRCEIINSTGAILGSGVGARNVKTDDYGDMNKSLKMAEKSAHIDATLRMAGLSEIFTQDVGDDKPAANDPPASAPPANTPPQPPRSAPRAPAAAPKPGAPFDLNRFEAYCIAKLVNIAKGNWRWWKYAVAKGWILSTEVIEAMVVEGHLCSDNVFGIDPSLKVEENRDRAAKSFKAHESAVAAMVDNMAPEEAELAAEAFKIVSSGAGQKSSPAAPATGGASAPAPEAKKTAAAPNAFACPKCKGTATKQSEDYEAVMWCQKCGFQWDNAGKPFESHPWMFVICPIPPKGTKRNEYTPQTMGQIARTDNSRWYGLVMNNSEEKARAGREYQGKHYNSSPQDIAFGAACDKARAYMESQKADKQPGGGDDGGAPTGGPEDDVPF